MIQAFSKGVQKERIVSLCLRANSVMPQFCGKKNLVVRGKCCKLRDFFCDHGGRIEAQRGLRKSFLWANAKLCYPNGRTSSGKNVNGKTEQS